MIARDLEDFYLHPSISSGSLLSWTLAQTPAIARDLRDRILGENRFNWFCTGFSCLLETCIHYLVFFREVESDGSDDSMSTFIDSWWNSICSEDSGVMRPLREGADARGWDQMVGDGSGESMLRPVDLIFYIRIFLERDGLTISLPDAYFCSTNILIVSTTKESI